MSIHKYLSIFSSGIVWIAWVFSLLERERVSRGKERERELGKEVDVLKKIPYLIRQESIFFHSLKQKTESMEWNMLSIVAAPLLLPFRSFIFVSFISLIRHAMPWIQSYVQQCLLVQTQEQQQNVLPYFSVALSLLPAHQLHFTFIVKLWV